MALLTDIQDATGGGSTCSLFQVPLDAIQSAADALQDLKSNPPAGIRQLATQIRTLELPDIDRSADLAAAIRSLRDQLPTDTSAITGQLSGAIDDFFGGVDTDLTGGLSGMLGGFDGLDSIGGLQVHDGEGPEPNFVITSIQALRDQLGNLPDPITVPDLLAYLRDGLQRMPRNIIPFRYLPIVDELRDKLETALAWKDMTGTELAANLGQTLTRLAAAIDRTFITDAVGKVADEIENLGNQIDDTAINTAFTDLGTGMDSLRQAVLAGDLSGSAPDIALVVERLQSLRTALHNIDDKLLDGQAEALNRLFEGLGEDLDDRALQFLAVLNPPSDLDLLSFLLTQVNTLIENTGVANLITKVGEFLGAIRGFLNSLNISAIKDTLLQVVQTAVDAVETLRNTLIQVTIEFSAIMERVRDAIESLGISDIVDAMENALNSFTQSIQNSVAQLFQPVRDFLLGAFSGLNDFLQQIDPTVAVQTLRDVISTFTNLLSNPQLLDALDTVRAALDTVNTELSGFSFRPGSDVVVQAIGVVESALEIASGLPLPDSLKKEVRDALNKLPNSIDPAVEIITDGLDEIIEEGPMPVLEAIKNGPKKVVEIVSRYSPDKLIGDCLSAAFQEFLEKMQAFKPTELIAPVQTALDTLKDAVRDAIDPVALMAPLQEPFDELLALLDAIDPQAIIAPLNEQLQAGIHAITDNIPLEATNAIFDKVAEIAAKIQEASDVLNELQGLFTDIQTKLAGLQDAEQQIADFGDQVAGSIQGLSDISPFSNAMTEVGDALTRIHAAGLQGLIDPVVLALRNRLTALDIKAKLTALAAARVDFPRAALDALSPPSLEQTNLAAFLDSFNPVQAEFAAPVDFIDNWGDSLEEKRTAFNTHLGDWDSRILNPQGPMMQLHQPSLTLQDLQTMLSTTIETQLSNALTPIFRSVDHFQTALNGLITEVNAFIADVNSILTGILEITDALEELRVAINGLVDTLNNFNLNFIADEIQAVFDALRPQFEAIDPSHIAEILSTAFNALLDILDINNLLGAQALDDQYSQLLTTLKSFDPGKLVVEVLQPEFDKVLEFLKRLDLTVQIDGFTVQLDRLREELRTELERCADAYESMWNAIPSSFGTVTGTATVSVTV